MNAATPAVAQTPYYQNKQLRVLVGFTPGGGTDLYGRVVAEGLARFVEGKPSVIVQNMPGASSVVAMNYFVQKAPHDGTYVLIASGQSLMRVVLGLDGATLDLVESWAADGTLPNLARLLRQGAYGRLASTTPAATFPSWTTFMTGVNPGRHGVFDFTRSRIQV